MKSRFIALAPVSLGLLLLITPAFSNPKSDDDIHQYTIAVEGTQNVKLQMLLVSKPSAASAPTRISKVITVPFETTFDAASFYVWFDTLDGRANGKDGDQIMGSYKIDGELQGGGFGGRIKNANKKSFSCGNL